MSLWTCPEHGLYGGDVFCPSCGKNGHYTTIAPAQRFDSSDADWERAWANLDCQRYGGSSIEEQGDG